jgi:copper homeostasis protein
MPESKNYFCYKIKLAPMLFEICAANVQSAHAAEAAGAHRIELCSALDTGGLTPSSALIRHTVKVLHIPVHVLIRPREGHFCYSDEELEIMCEDIRFCREAGARGVVFAALTPDGKPDLPALEALRKAAENLECTFHRAIDVAADPFAVMDAAIGLGFHRILSSGQAPSALEGRFLLQKMTNYAAGRIVVMPGAGISPTNIAEIAHVTGAKEFHFSGRIWVEEIAGRVLPGLEAGYYVSQADTIRQVMFSLD